VWSGTGNRDGQLGMGRWGWPLAAHQYAGHVLEMGPTVLLAHGLLLAGVCRGRHGVHFAQAAG